MFAKLTYQLHHTAPFTPSSNSLRPHTHTKLPLCRSSSTSSPPVTTTTTTSNANDSVDQIYKPFLDDWDKGFIDTPEYPDPVPLSVSYGTIPPQLSGKWYRNGPGKFNLSSSSSPSLSSDTSKPKQSVSHPYDGDGYIAQVTIKNSQAFLRGRFIQTAEYMAELKEERVLFRGTFGTQRAGGPLNNIMDLHVKNTSNTNVIAWGKESINNDSSNSSSSNSKKKVWGLFEAGQPYELNAETLETVGIDTLGGKLALGMPFDLGSDAANASFEGFNRFMQQVHGIAEYIPEELARVAGDAVTAHPKIDPINNRLVTFSYKMCPSLGGNNNNIISGGGSDSGEEESSGSPSFISTKLTFWEIDDQWQVIKKKDYAIAGFGFVHDFFITENYYGFFQNPVTVDNVPYISGVAPAAACVRWQAGQPTLLHLIPRGENKEEGGGTSSTSNSSCRKNRVFKAPPLFIFHHANAFEQAEHNKIVIDSVHYDSLPAVGREALAEQQLDPDAGFNSRLRRVTVDLDTGILKVSSSAFPDKYLEMVSVNPQYIGRRHRYVYGYHSIFEDPGIAIAKIDMTDNSNNNSDKEQADIWAPGPGWYALEPRFIPRSLYYNGEEDDDGWLICQLFDAVNVKSHLAILDAKKVSDGPVAIIDLPAPLPHNLHSYWDNDDS